MFKYHFINSNQSPEEHLSRYQLSTSLAPDYSATVSCQTPMSILLILYFYGTYINETVCTIVSLFIEMSVVIFMVGNYFYRKFSSFFGS